MFSLFRKPTTLEENPETFRFLFLSEHVVRLPFLFLTSARRT